MAESVITEESWVDVNTKTGEPELFHIHFGKGDEEVLSMCYLFEEGSWKVTRPQDEEERSFASTIEAMKFIIKEWKVS